MDRGRWRIRTNQELYQMCGENDIVKFCNLSRLRWAGHVIRQDDNDLSRRVLLSEPGGKCPRGRPRLRWEDGGEEDVARLGCRNWKTVALNRDGWRKLLKEAEAHPELQRRWRERERERESRRHRIRCAAGVANVVLMVNIKSGQKPWQENVTLKS